MPLSSMILLMAARASARPCLGPVILHVRYGSLGLAAGRNCTRQCESCSTRLRFSPWRPMMRPTRPASTSIVSTLSPAGRAPAPWHVSTAAGRTRAIASVVAAAAAVFPPLVAVGIEVFSESIASLGRAGPRSPVGGASSVVAAAGVAAAVVGRVVVGLDAILRGKGLGLGDGVGDGHGARADRFDGAQVEVAAGRGGGSVGIRARSRRRRRRVARGGLAGICVGRRCRGIAGGAAGRSTGKALLIVGGRGGSGSLGG
ncbi:hypothetical protein VTK73DRAFT_2634 [Phialemonium thermophilum]|uniref:Uncharacterized protein n=1 Tax=Phialemonium thermophilum TaxID=223376 RepID=A0ABR3VRL6_9PEZI